MTPGIKERYSRQARFPGIGEDGQARLSQACAAVVGCGALGTQQAAALARAGVGRLILIDRDYVDWSNLQRQWLFNESDAQRALPKAAAAKTRLAEANSACDIRAEIADLTPANIDDLLTGADVVLDGTDNFEARYLLNDYCIQRGVPWIYGAAVGSYGLTMPVLPGITACLRCVYPDPPSGVQPTCETAGVLNTLTALIACLQTTDALKLLCGKPESVRPVITTTDIWNGPLREVRQPARDPDCPACARHEFVYLNGSRRAPISLCGRNAVQIHERARPLDLRHLQEQLSSLGEVRANEFALRFVLPPYEMTIFPDGRAIVKGTTEIGVARSLYARYVGN